MKIEICALSEFSEFDLEKTFFFQILKKKIVLKSFFKTKEANFFFSSVKCQDGSGLRIILKFGIFFFEVGIYMVTAFNSQAVSEI